MAACLVLSSIDGLELPVCLLGSQLRGSIRDGGARFRRRPSPRQSRAAPPRRVSCPSPAMARSQTPPQSGDPPSAGLSATGRTSCRSWVTSSSPRLDASPADRRRSIRLGKHPQEAGGGSSSMPFSSRLPSRAPGFEQGVLPAAKQPIHSLRSMLLRLDVCCLLDYLMCSLHRLFIQLIMRYYFRDNTSNS